MLPCQSQQRFFITRAWRKVQVDLAYSGGDDCTLKGWDLRMCGTPTFVNRKTHAAGVCCIASHPSKESMFVSGSYDDHARLWDARNTSMPVATAQVLLPPSFNSSTGVVYSFNFLHEKCVCSWLQQWRSDNVMVARALSLCGCMCITTQAISHAWTWLQQATAE